MPHVDAFKMITYRAEDNSSIELVWNSRDDAAPATIVLRDGKIARRVNVREPVLENHQPSLGHMVLIDCTEEWAYDEAERVADAMWMAGDRHGCESQAVLEVCLFTSYLSNVEAHYARAVVVDVALTAAHGWVVPV